MTFTRAIGAVLVSALLFAILGGGIGLGLGWFAPGYYRSVFDGGHDPRFDPVSVGLGQGLTQGAAGGVVAGLVIVALLCWRDLRISGRSDSASTAPAGWARTSARVLLVAGALLGMIICMGAGLLVGGLAGTGNAYHRQYLQERDALAPVVAADPAFSEIEIDELSRGGATLVGTLESPAELDRLRAAVILAIGQGRVEEIVSGIWVPQEGQRATEEQPEAALPASPATQPRINTTSATTGK